MNECQAQYIYYLLVIYYHSQSKCIVSLQAEISITQSIILFQQRNWQQPDTGTLPQSPLVYTYYKLTCLFSLACFADPNEWICMVSLGVCYYYYYIAMQTNNFVQRYQSSHSSWSFFPLQVLRWLWWGWRTCSCQVLWLRDCLRTLDLNEYWTTDDIPSRPHSSLKYTGIICIWVNDIQWKIWWGQPGNDPLMNLGTVTQNMCNSLVWELISPRTRVQFCWRGDIPFHFWGRLHFKVYSSDTKDKFATLQQDIAINISCTWERVTICVWAWQNPWVVRGNVYNYKFPWKKAVSVCRLILQPSSSLQDPMRKWHLCYWNSQKSQEGSNGSDNHCENMFHGYGIPWS